MGHAYAASKHTSADAAIHVQLRDGGLGIIELRRKILSIMLKRLINIGERLTYLDSIEKVMHKLSNMAGNEDPNNQWRQKIIAGVFTSRLEESSYSFAIRSWLTSRPKGWLGRNDVWVVQARSGNVAPAAIPSNFPEQQGCREGCSNKETLYDLLQGCLATHWLRIQRHNEIAKKIAGHCRNTRKPQPDILIYQGDNIIVVDV